MTRRISLPLAADVTATECGSCDYASLMPWTEPTIYICTRPEFARRTPSGGYETAERPGRVRLPACLAAEREHAAMVERPSAEAVEAFLSVRRYVGHSGAHDDVCDAVDVLSEYFDRTGGANA